MADVLANSDPPPPRRLSAPRNLPPPPVPIAVLDVAITTSGDIHDSLPDSAITGSPWPSVNSRTGIVARLSAREVARSLGTSPTQLYRLLDPTNHTKSLRQLMALLYLLGCDVDVEVNERAAR